MLSSFHLVNEKEIVDILNVFVKKNDHVSAIELKMKDVFPISTQEVMLPEVELQFKNQKNTKKLKKSKLKFKKLNKSMVKVVARKATCSKMLRRNHLYDLKKTTSKGVEGEYYLTV